jgi:hypothetical protein
MAKSRYTAYTNAASSLSASATSLASQASASASTAVYGDAKYQASKSISSIAAQATNPIVKALDDSKDYVYSTWDDNRLRAYLETHGAIQTKSEKSRAELLAAMKDTYGKAANPVWNAWSDSYIVSRPSFL